MRGFSLKKSTEKYQLVTFKRWLTKQFNERFLLNSWAVQYIFLETTNQISLCFYYTFHQKTCLYMYLHLAFNSQQVNVGGIQHFLAQFQRLEMRKETLNTAIIYRIEIKFTKCKHIDRSFECMFQPYVASLCVCLSLCSVLKLVS